MSSFRKAQRSATHLKIALQGLPGSGKTYSSIRLAAGLGSKVVLIDTENGSGELYSDLADYDYVRLTPPFTPSKCVDLIREAVADGYDCIIIDSFSEFWKYILSYKDTLDAQNFKKSFNNWGKVKPIYDELKLAILHCPAHVICDLRSKHDHVQTTDGRGNTTIQKVGTAAITEPENEYEFTTVFEIDRTHTAVATKDRTSLFMDRAPFTISEHTGREIVAWLGAGTFSVSPEWRQVAVRDEATAEATLEADRTMERATTQPVENYRDVIARWGMSTQDWADWKATLEREGFKASDSLHRAFKEGARDLQDAYDFLQRWMLEIAESKAELESVASAEGPTPDEIDETGRKLVEGEPDAPKVDPVPEVATSTEALVSEILTGTAAPTEPVLLESPPLADPVLPESPPSAEPVSSDTSSATKSAAIPDGLTLYGYRPVRWPLPRMWTEAASDQQRQMLASKALDRGIDLFAKNGTRDIPEVSQRLVRMLMESAKLSGVEESKAAWSLAIDWLLNSTEDQLDSAGADLYDLFDTEAKP